MIQEVMAKGKRVHITLSTNIYAEVERLAEEESRPVASVVRFLVEKEVKRIIEERNKQD